MLDTLADIERVLGDRQVCVGREITKMYEEWWRGAVSAARHHFGGDKIRGELTLVVAGAAPEAERWSESEVLEALRSRISGGQSRRDAAAEVTELSGWRKKHVYQLSLTVSDS